MASFKTSDGLSLHFEDEGAGLPILCLAGLTRDGRDFEYVLPHLKGCRVIRLDYRGRGQSDWATDFTTYNIMREAQDALELLDHLGLAQAAILGTSRGGLIAMGLAATVKARLLGVAINDVGPVIDPKGIEAIMTYLGVKPKAKTLAEAAAARAHVMRDMFKGVPQSRWDEEVAKFFVQTDDGLDLTYDPKLRDAVEAASTAAVPDLWPWLEALDGLPCAIIRGANSDLLTQDTYNEMLHRLPKARGTVVPNRAHVPFLDEPEAVSLLQNWIGEMQ
jgi:pimeloyl-ACP methyl ester carboxylesterase